MVGALSERELEVLELVARGNTNAQIAGDLGISPLTVKKHLERMYSTVGARNRAELIARTYTHRRTEHAPGALDVVGVGASPTSFIGREREQAEVAALLERARLVTLGGPGGIGKTRLAMVVAAAVARRYADGVRLVELGALADARLLVQTVAAVLAVRERPGSRVATLISALQDKELLLVVDNCEHLAAASAQLVTEILRGCPGIRVLATSREALGVPGEAFSPVPPLSVPAERPDPLEVGRAEAVRLFVDRASSRLAGFDLTPENARTVAQVCRSLDGVPLAIELAAARMNELSVEDIASRPDDRFLELRTDAPDVIPRHRTLRGVIDWSYQLLTPAEATLFERLSVFAGAFTLDSAENVCSGGTVERAGVLELLSRLVDKSFVVADVTARRTARYRFLETLQRYGRERLGVRGEANDLARRHAAYFCAVAERAEPELRGPRQLWWFEELDADHDDMRAALRWAFELDPVTAARIAAALWRFWFHRAHSLEGKGWVEQALAVKDLPLPLRGKVLNAAGNLLAGADPALSEARHRANLAIQRQLREPSRWGLTAALSNLGDRLRERGALAEARELYEEALALRDEPWGLALTTSQLGHVALDEGDLAEAQRCYAEALRLWRAAGDRVRAAGAVSFAARVAREQGRYARAEQLYRRSIVTYRALGDRYAMARELVLISLVAMARGDVARALLLFAAAMSAHKEFGAEIDVENIDARLLRAVREGLARDDGAGMGLTSLDEAVEYALAASR